MQQDMFSGHGGSAELALSTVQVVPLGKYKGKPFDVLLTDAAYALWLLSSMYSKLEHQHPELFAFLISRFGPPDQTPVHNALQNRFLDETFCIRFALASSAGLRAAAEALSLFTLDLEAFWRKNVQDSFEPCLRLSEFSSNMAVLAQGLRELSALRDTLLREGVPFELVGADPSLGPDGERCVPLRLDRLEFEADGADVGYRLDVGYVLSAVRHSVDFEGYDRRKTTVLSELACYTGWRIEVKPVVGDDYPVVLRRMKTARVHALLIGEYTGTGATWEQLVKVFALSGIGVVLLEDVERVDVPPCLREIPVRRLTQESAAAILAQEYEAHVAALRQKVAERVEPAFPVKEGQYDTPF